MYSSVAHEMPLWVNEDYPRSQEELAKETFFHRRSGAIAALSSWMSLDEERNMQRHDIVEPPKSCLSSEAEESLEKLVEQFECSLGSSRQALCSHFDDASSELSMENYEKVIDDFSVRKKKFAQAVVGFAVNAFEEGMKIIEEFQTKHRGHPQYKCSLSFLLLVHSDCRREITDEVSCVVNGYDIDFQQYLEHLEPELQRKAQQKMEEAGLKYLLRC